ncbi:uncharacterized protein LOC124260148 [Haliotis rubra]|uniref:uncharacterized protein LOC124260148 n=1 Tax=Haliotis rubra TaxID=36100 RepID=UPI001EE56AAB|nr:uncharacterized protein LOC124260148 [Haliotis rubra]
MGNLEVDEIEDAEMGIISQMQQQEFAKEFSALQKGKQLPKDSKLIGLQPIIDEEGLIRCSGRLKYADCLSWGARVPIILPRKNWVTRLIVKHYHEAGKHAVGTNQTLAALSSKYWVIAAREEIRAWETECAFCRRQKAQPRPQIMAPLPKLRVSYSLRAFTHVGVDYAGPFLTIQGRLKKRQKRYLCLFTCLSTRAVHLEMSYGLDSDSFLNAFFRMTNRRGMPKEVVSDNGTNFVGAVKELRDLVEQLDATARSSLTNKGVVWRFNPPHAPHFGGVFECMIKSAKRAIFAILGKGDVTDEELTTAFTAAEALINSRPLTYQSANCQDDVPLTPNHLMHGQVGGTFAPDSVDTTSYNPRKRWRRIQELVRHFWRRWLRELLPTLQVRKKWREANRNLKVNDVVIVVSPDSPRGSWPLGRIINTYPGKDGHVRVVQVKMGKTTLMRPVTKVCPLEWNSEDDLREH